MPITRKVRYNFKTDTGEQVIGRYRWTVAILNDLREIRRIQERLLIQLVPVFDLTTNYESSIPNSNGLKCRIFSFSSGRGKIERPNDVYVSGEFKKDRDLIERTDAELQGYVNRLARS